MRFAPSRNAPLARELRRILAIGVPVAGTQFSFMLLGAIDSALVGHLDPRSLAAVAMAGTWSNLLLGLSLGLVLGAEPFMSRAFGRGDAAELGLGRDRALVVAGLASLPLLLFLLATRQALEFFGQPSDIAELAGRYNLWKLPSVPAFLVYMALRLHLQAQGQTRPALWVALFTSAQNLVLGWALVFGHLGLPALGLTGAALNSVLTSITSPLLLALWARTHRVDARRTFDRRAFASPGLLAIARLGLPIGFQIVLETCGFAFVVYFVGRLGAVPLGAHQIGMQVAALAFMLPLGIGVGGATRVAQSLGARSKDDAVRATGGALGIAVAASLVSGPLLFFLRDPIAGLFTDDPTLRAPVSTLVAWVALFQPFDAVHAVCLSILRGRGKPLSGAVANTLGFACSLPFVAHAAGHGFDIGTLWFGLFARLAIVALVLAVWLVRTTRRSLDELVVSG